MNAKVYLNISQEKQYRHPIVEYFKRKLLLKTFNTRFYQNNESRFENCSILEIKIMLVFVPRWSVRKYIQAVVFPYISGNLRKRISFHTN